MYKKSLILTIALLLVVSLFAGCAKEAVQPTPKTEVNSDVVTDVLVIGGGGAGLVSAITAAEEGANVILVEKLSAVGGNTIISATGTTASDTKIHEAAGITFTVQDHIEKTMKEGKDLPNLELVTILVKIVMLD